MEMPVGRFYNLLKWKSRLEEEKSRIIREKSGKFQTGPSTRK